MAGEIQIMIPQYGELNRIYSDFIVSHTFSFDKQKFITDFYKQYNDTKAFEAAILELVLDKQKEKYTLILNSLRTEIEKNILIYEKHPLFDDEIISRVCYNFADRYDADIKAQLEVTQKLSKPLNEAYNRYDSIGYRVHTAAEEKQAEKEYERCKAEYEKEKEELDRLYELERQARKESLQYIENCCGDIYKLKWEKELARIERGELSDDTFRKEIEAYTREITSELISCDKLFGSRDSGCACPKCGTGRMRFYGKVVRCDNTECGLPVFRLKAGRTLSDDEIKDLLTEGHTKLLKGFKSKQGKSFDAVVAFDGEYNTTFVFPEAKKDKKFSGRKK
ncbi:hypothetical protein IMSAGC006_01940 [Muribaculaceae bacterium]|nr:hypothetical protein IMSAGC006_01940 [Muribaculaceae bacterium]